MGLTVAISALFIVLSLALVTLKRCFTSAHRLRFPVTAEWINELTIDHYRPMLRLLDGDLEFLRTQPGVTPQVAHRFRLQRCRLLQAYLRNLENDFRCVCTALKILMVQSKHDRRDLASALIWKQLAFAWGMLIARCRLRCYLYGGSVGVIDLVNLFDNVRLELRTLIPTLGQGFAS